MEDVWGSVTGLLSYWWQLVWCVLCSGAPLPAPIGPLALTVTSLGEQQNVHLPLSQGSCFQEMGIVNRQQLVGKWGWTSRGFKRGMDSVSVSFAHTVKNRPAARLLSELTTALCHRLLTLWPFSRVFLLFGWSSLTFRNEGLSPSLTPLFCWVLLASLLLRSSVSPRDVVTDCRKMPLACPGNGEWL